MQTLVVNVASNEKMLSKEVLEAVVANTADAILALDPNGRIWVFNKEAEKLYSTDTQEVAGHAFAEVCLLHSHLDPVNDLILETVKHPNVLLNQDVTITLSDGSKQYFNVRTRLLKDCKSEERLGIVVVISDITQRIEANIERTESGKFVFMVIMSLLVAMGVNGIVLKTFPSINVYSTIFAWIYTIAILLPVLVYIIWMKRPVTEFGLTWNNWKQATGEGLVISVVFFFGGLLTLMALGASEGKTLTDFMNPHLLGWETIAYIPHSVMQEFVFRGVVLLALLRMFRDHSKWLPLLISALLFGFLHTHLGWSAIVMTFGIGMLFGWMFLRHGNLIGVSIVHVLLGVSSFFFGIL